MNYAHFAALYLVAINLIAFFAMGSDKRKAKRRRNRIPEKTLMMLAIIGGSLGANAGMLIFRHKTQHPKFRYGLPLILIIHVVLAVIIL